MSYNNLNNDILSIISIYANFPIRLKKNKLKIYLKSKCESCEKRIRTTKKSIAETYVFPKLWKLDNAFYSQRSKYIRSINTFIKYNKNIISYQNAYNDGLVHYTRIGGSRNDLFGTGISKLKNIDFLVKKHPSLELMYKSLRKLIDGNESVFLQKLKEYNIKGINTNIMNKCLKNINVENCFPEKMLVLLCFQCRKKLKKGYIFC